MERALTAALLALVAGRARGLGTRYLATEVTRSIDLVVVADNFPLDWIDPVLQQLPGARLRLYCRGHAWSDKRCSRSRTTSGPPESGMLRHVLDHYDDLADITVFTHEDIQENSTGRQALQHVLNLLDRPSLRANFSGFAAHRYYPITSKRMWNGGWLLDRCPPSSRPFGPWYLKFINASDTQLEHMHCAAASLDSIFAVTADRVRSNARALYERLLKEVDRCPGPKAAAGQFLERSWAALFSAGDCHRESAWANLRKMQSGQEAFPEGQRDLSVDLVVATHRANLSWIDDALRRVPRARLHLYCKGSFSRDPRCIRMENVGTEEYAYFKHILSRWDSLADITLFTIDNMDNVANYVPTVREGFNYLLGLLDSPAKRANFRGFEAHHFMPVTQHYDIRYYHSSSVKGDNLTALELCRPTEEPYGKWYLKFINPEDTRFSHLACTGASMHGVFAVSAKRVRQVPKERFAQLVQEVEHCRGVNHFTAGHYMERSWAPLFAERCHAEEAAFNLKRSKWGLTHWEKTLRDRRATA